MAQRLSADPFKYHRGSKGIWERLRKALVANPQVCFVGGLSLDWPHSSINSGLVDVNVQRNPPPGSRPEIYAKPASKVRLCNLPCRLELTHGQASDVADNPYYVRDTRRAYPKYQPVTQSYLAELLLSAPEKSGQLG
jgi:hypothetical protein